MTVKNKFCWLVDLATFTPPPPTKIPGSAPATNLRTNSYFPTDREDQDHKNKKKRKD